MTDDTEASVTARADEDHDTSPTPITARRRSRLGLYGLLAIGAVTAGVVVMQLDGEALLRSAYSGPPRGMDVTPGGEQLAESERYRTTLRQANLGGAREANRSGQSFLATPDEPSEPLRDIDDRPAAIAPLGPQLPPANERAQAEPAEPEVEYVPVDRPVYYEYRRAEVTENDYSDIDALAAAMARQAGDLAERGSRSRLEVIIEQDLYRARDDQRLGVNAAERSRQLRNGMVEPASTQEVGEQSFRRVLDGGTYGADLDVGLGRIPDPALELPVGTGPMPRTYSPYGYPLTHQAAVPSSLLAKAGSVAYARIVNGTDSDTPGPIIVEVLRGPLRGARLIGSFTTNRETTALIVQFDRVVLEDATIVPTTAYAVDAVYGELPVRSAYDGRYLQRYAPRLAGAFLRGAGAAVASTGATVVGVGDSVAIVRPEASAVEAIAAGVSGVGEQLADEIEDLGPETGLVKLYANKLVGVLFLDNVERPR